MPSIFEYWTTMAYCTCNNYMKRYTDVAALKAGIQRHASTNGVQINLEENISDIARFRQGIPRQKRPIAKKISEAPPPKRARIADIRIENAQLEELQAAAVAPPAIVVVDALPAIVVVDALPAIALNNDSPVIVVVDAPPAIAVNGARKPLVLNGLVIEVDPQTLMVNATQICKAGGKLFGDYHRNKCYKDFENELSEAMGIPIANLTKCENGNREGTMVHRQIALYLAQKISPLFAVQVTRWIDELRIENDQLLTQIEELQTAAAISPPAIAVNGTRKPLVLNGITIEVDPQTLMVNATQMCSAAGKFYAHYSTTIGMTEYKNALSSAIGIPIGELIKCKNGNREGTMVHRRVALYLAQKLSPVFAVQVTGWLEELFMTGRVELGNEMSPQQLDEAWQQRVQEEQARHQQATEALETRHRQATEALETRITTMERQGELAEQKTREELDAAIKTLARDTDQMPQFPDGANVLYAGYIGNWLIKYGQSSNFIRRLAEHRRHYPEFMLIKALPCDNAVASEKKLREFVAKKRIGGNYNNEKEIICFETQEDVYKLIRAMQRSCCNKDSAVSVELKRIEAEVEIKRIEAEVKRIEAEVEIKRMDVEKDKKETMRMKMIADKIITFEQYLQMNK